MRCLIVDDNELSLEMSVSVVDSLGVEVEGSSCGSEAIERIRTASERPFSVVLMDYRMPEMDGAETCAKIRSMEAEGILSGRTMIIGLSGDTDEATRQIFADAGADGLIGKPIDLQELGKWLNLEVAEKDSTVVEEPWVQELQDSDFDAATGMHFAGTAALYHRYLEDFRRLSREKRALLREFLGVDEIERFTIEIHAMKSTSRSLGNSLLSDICKKLEEAGDRVDRTEIDRLLPKFEELMDHCEETLSRALKKDETPKRIPAPGEAEEIAAVLEEALRAYDIDTADHCLDDLQKLMLSEDSEALLEELAIALSAVDYSRALRAVKTLREVENK